MMFNFVALVCVLAVLHVTRADMSAGKTPKAAVKDPKELKTLRAGNPKNFNHDLTVYNNATLKGKNSWVSFKQCDSRWGGNRLGWCDQFTICTAGCAMTSMAMMLNTRGVNIDPGTLDQYLADNGGYYDGCDVLWASADNFGVTSFQGIEYADEESICWGLSQGHGIIANVMNGGHFVLLTGCAGGGVFYVNDPGFNRDTYTIWDIVSEAVYW